MAYTIDINADLGEGTGKDVAIMPLISSCSIACGGHYGTEKTMRKAILLAKKHNVKVGAHPSFPDTNNFGRKIVTMTKSELIESILNQLTAFFDICTSESISVHHVKCHGALYNYSAIDALTADAVVEAILATKQRPKLYVQHGSILHKKAENLLPLQFEAFIDRRYTQQGTLVPRSHAKAIIHAPKKAWKQLLQMITNNKVKTIDKQIISIIATTYCIHSDHKDSVAILNYLHSQFQSHKIDLI
ncbi:5-oxoprolinase subunit PxpA [Jejudonia soesokkakensis]|uniref:5-oxoprolinase subunit PxpA n=1 Tax=Jejudonia soesokkakensis TaxID=1323432 RepID=A0ABW2MUC4_9FLAO